MARRVAHPALRRSLVAVTQIRLRRAWHRCKDRLPPLAIGVRYIAGRAPEDHDARYFGDEPAPARVLPGDRRGGLVLPRGGSPAGGPAVAVAADRCIGGRVGR